MLKNYFQLAVRHLISNKVFAVVFVLDLAIGMTGAEAQLQIPEASPPGRVIQKIGFTNIAVYYERPSVRGRSEAQIFGELVPFGKVWRTGAGNCTTISFDTDVLINTQTVRKGKYALFTIPDKKSWTIILNTDTLAYGAYNYDKAKDVVRIEVKARNTDRYYEALTIDIDFIPNDARIYISWLNTQVSFDVSTGLDKEILSFIRENLISRESDNPELYESAIVYYLWHQQDRKQIMKFIDRGIELKNDRVWYYWKVQELIKDKRYTEARVAAEAAIQVIRNSDESAERKTELIRDFENYIVKLSTRYKK
jgi:hypothetical protein